MKSLFIIPLVLMSLVSSPSWALGMDDLVKRDGLWYQKFTATPFTGEVEGRWRGSIKNGKQEGSWEDYWPNGQLAMKGDYKNGKLDGSYESYSSSGQLLFKGNHKNGMREGFWESYHLDGSVLELLGGTYKNGVKVSD